MRNKITILLKGLILLTLISSILVSSEGEEMEGIVATKFDSDIDIHNGVIDAAWVNVTDYLHVDPIGGEVKFAINETHLYGLIIADKSEAWVSLEFEADSGGCMLSGHDGWVFYLDGVNVTAKDVIFDGLIKPSDDTINDIYMEYIYKESTVEIEIVRKWDTGGAGDYVLENDTLVTMTLASASDHYGARTIYYLIPFYSILDDVIIEPPVVVLTDWIAIKKWIFFGALGFSALFIIVHFLIRNILKPLKHGSRIVDDEFEPPHITQRWDVFRGREPRIRGD